jgi:hypothetical protein
MIWLVPATDAVGRRRDIVIEATPGHVGVAFPPGGGVSLDPTETDALATTLHMAASHARATGP